MPWLAGDQLVERLDESVLDIFVLHSRAAAGLVACVFMVALPDCVLIFRVRRPRLTPIPRPTLRTLEPGGEQADLR